MRSVTQRRLVIAIVSGGLALILLMSIGVYGLLIGPPKTASSVPRTLEMPGPSEVHNQAAEPHPVIVTARPEGFARSVAQAVFTWDTRHEGGPSEWAQSLVDVAHPEEAAAVASDVRGYLPSPEMWDRLATYGTRQWLELESIAIPSTWFMAIEQATAGQIPRGAAAFTIAGTRKRLGSWGTDVVRTERVVTFTIFVVCSERESCALLRLSQPDQALP
jgi:hypothetical protein